MYRLPKPLPRELVEQMDNVTPEEEIARMTRIPLAQIQEFKMKKR